jgi:hypothetical protein
VLAEQFVEPTLVHADHFDVEEGTLVVTEEGQLIDHVDESGDAGPAPEGDAPATENGDEGPRPE